MKERIYCTPRTYGNPTGYDIELSHYPSHHARLAEKLLLELCRFGVASETVAKEACDLAASAVSEFESRGWLLPVEDAPKMDRDYGQKRGAA